MRRDAREAVYRLLYSYFLTEEWDGELKKNCFAEHKLNDKDVEFADGLIARILESESKHNESISELANSFSFDRINYLDRAALVIAMTEIDFYDDIDAAVSIDEAVRLVKKYSTENSLAFVNGMLAEYVRRKGNA